MRESFNMVAIGDGGQPLFVIQCASGVRAEADVAWAEAKLLVWMMARVVPRYRVIVRMKFTAEQRERIADVQRDVQKRLH